jgi:hypothetical protein
MRSPKSDIVVVVIESINFTWERDTHRHTHSQIFDVLLLAFASKKIVHVQHQFCCYIALDMKIVFSRKCGRQTYILSCQTPLSGQRLAGGSALVVAFISFNGASNNHFKELLNFLCSPIKKHFRMLYGPSK